jgi:hypothetical protein
LKAERRAQRKSEKTLETGGAPIDDTVITEEEIVFES